MSGLTLTQGRLVFLAFAAVTLGVVGYSYLNSETGNPKARDAVHDAAVKAEKLAKDAASKAEKLGHEAADKVKAESNKLSGKTAELKSSAKAKAPELQLSGGESFVISL